MKIKVERSGGLTGISISKEVKIDDLPSKLESIVKERIIDSKSSTALKSVPKGSADYYTYKISVEDGSTLRVIECSQFNIQEDLKFLIKYVEEHSNAK